MESNSVETQVKDYYGKTLKSSEDLKTNACCTVEVYPPHIKRALTNISDEVLAKYYGCGLTIPTSIHGLRVLDLGSGAGRDCYILSQLVGSNGFVTGVDMTPEQLQVARQNIEGHMNKFSYGKANVEFLEGDIQSLDSLGLNSESYDLVVSNCVVNLAPNKEAVLKGVYSVLKEGGEFYFSDVYADRRVPKELAKDPVLWGECLGGAMYWNDFENMAKRAGFGDPRIVESSPIEIGSQEVQDKVGDIRFFSVTYRLFKINQLETHCEDYGQAIVYKGTVDEQPHSFCLDDHHLFPKGKIMPVCGNTYYMLNNTRYRDHFEFLGNFDHHYGIFDGCGTPLPYDVNVRASGSQSESAGNSCC